MNETSALKGLLNESISQVDLLLNKIEQLMEGTTDEQTKEETTA
jgi:hypothetical protein